MTTPNSPLRLTTQAVMQVLTYDQLMELQTHLNKNTYYYLMLDPESEIPSLYDLRFATKIIATSEHHILEHLIQDERILQMMMWCKDFFDYSAIPKNPDRDEYLMGVCRYMINKGYIVLYNCDLKPTMLPEGYRHSTELVTYR